MCRAGCKSCACADQNHIIFFTLPKDIKNEFLVFSNQIFTLKTTSNQRSQSLLKEILLAFRIRNFSYHLEFSRKGSIFRHHLFCQKIKVYTVRQLTWVMPITIGIRYNFLFNWDHFSWLLAILVVKSHMTSRWCQMKIQAKTLHSRIFNYYFAKNACSYLLSYWSHLNEWKTSF